MDCSVKCELRTLRNTKHRHWVRSKRVFRNSLEIYIKSSRNDIHEPEVVFYGLRCFMISEFSNKLLSVYFLKCNQNFQSTSRHGFQSKVIVSNSLNNSSPLCTYFKPIENNNNRSVRDPGLVLLGGGAQSLHLAFNFIYILVWIIVTIYLQKI